MKRIVHFVHWPRTGITSLIRTMLPLLNTKEFSYEVWFLESDESAGSEFENLVDNIQLINAPNILQRYRKIRSLIKERKPDIIHVHSFQPGFWLALIAPQQVAVRTVHSEYPYFSQAGWSNKLKRFLESWSLRRSVNTLVSVSTGVQAGLPASYIHSKQLVIDNGIDLDAIKNSAAWPGQYGEEVSEFLKCDRQILYVSLGRLEHQKAFSLLIKALQNVRKRGIDAFLLIIGEGSELKQLEGLISGLNLSNYILLAGFFPHPHKLLIEADVYVSSSLYEGYGLSIAEAMCLGLPVVVTPTAGVPEMLSDRINALVTKDFKITSLADAMSEMAIDSNFRSELSSKGCIFASETLSIKTTAGKYELLYQSLLSEE